MPYLIQYDGDRSSGGQPAPIAKDWIQELGDGAYKEYMTEWWWVTDVPAPLRNGETEEARLARQATAWAFADEAIDKIDGFFGLATVPERPATPAASVDGTSVTVTWAAAGDGGAAITGYRVSLNGAAPVTVAATARSHTFTGVAAGPQAATVTAVNYIGASTASLPSPAVTVTTPSPDPTEGPSPEPTTSPSPQPSGSTSPLPSTGPSATPSLTVTGTLSANGTIRVSGSGLSPSAPVRVELHSTPVVLGTTTTTAAGAFGLTATVPAATTAGSHSIVVYVNGIEVARQAITIDGALAATGGDGIPVLGIGLGTGLVLVGALAALFVARRRQAA